jgi:hypothetical protein
MKESKIIILINKLRKIKKTNQLVEDLNTKKLLNSNFEEKKKITIKHNVFKALLNIEQIKIF